MWDIGQPSNYAGEEHCLEMNYQTRGKWNDRRCCDEIGYVCQIPSAKSIPYEYSDFTVYSGNDASSYHGAQQFCERHRSRLVLLQTDEDLEQLLSKMNAMDLKQFWINRGEHGQSCSSVTKNVVTTGDCLQPMPFICEEVAPHELHVSDEQPKIEPGTTFNVECSASGVPVPEVKWYKDGTYVPHQNQDIGKSTLLLGDISTADLGMYVCKAVSEIKGKHRIIKGYSFIEAASNLE